MSFRSKKVRMESLQRNALEVTSSSPKSKEQSISSGVQIPPEKMPQQSRPSGSTNSNEASTFVGISELQLHGTFMSSEKSNTYVSENRARMHTQNTPTAGDMSRPTSASCRTYRMLPQNLPKLSKSLLSEKIKMLPDRRFQGNQVMYGPFTPHSSSSHISRKLSDSPSTPSQSGKNRDSSLSNPSLMPYKHNPLVPASAALHSERHRDPSLSSPFVTPSGHKTSVPPSSLHSKDRPDSSLCSPSLVPTGQKSSVSAFASLHSEKCPDSSLSSPSVTPTGHKPSVSASPSLHSETRHNFSFSASTTLPPENCQDSSLSNPSLTPFVNKPSFPGSTTLHSEKHRAPSLPDPTLNPSTHVVETNQSSEANQCVDTHVPDTYVPGTHVAATHVAATHVETTVGDAAMDPMHLSDYENDMASDHSQLKKSTGAELKKVSKVRGWPHEIIVGTNEQVLTIGTDGTEKLVGGSIQPRDVSKQNDVRYFVRFNELKQPIGKGGEILIKFLSYVAKMERFCPIAETDWRRVNKKLKADIIELVRAKFVIPQGEIYDKRALQRVDKFWRNYKCSLKKKFNPKVRPIEAIYEDKPTGHPRNSWMKLVDYWASPKGQDKSLKAKAARASQDLLHTTGSISFANMREHFKLKRPPSNLEFFELTHKPKDEEFPDNSMSKEFLEHAKSKVEESLANCSPSKSRMDVENDIFNELMYKEDDLKRPVGYGFGVNKSAIFGVHGELRKRGYHYADNTMTTRLLTKHNQELRRRNVINEAKINESNQKINQSNQLLLQLLDAMSTGRVTEQFLSATRQKVLRMSNSQVPMGSGGHCDTNSRSMQDDSFGDEHEFESRGEFDNNDSDDANIGSEEDIPSSNYSPSP